MFYLRTSDSNYSLQVNLLKYSELKKACPSISKRRTQSHGPLLAHVISFGIQFSLFRSATLCDSDAAHGFSCNMQHCLVLTLFGLQLLFYKPLLMESSQSHKISFLILTVNIVCVCM